MKAEISFKQETIEMAQSRANAIGSQWAKEVERLLQTGGIDPESHNRGMLFGLALENIADNYLRGERKSKDYKNLKLF